MADPVANARSMFPTIQITLASIVVALALQELLDSLPKIDALWEFTIVGACVWCQVLVGFVIIFKMWAGFMLTAVAIERVPRPLDLLGPIIVLVFLDAQIACIGLEHMLLWWYVLGAGSLVAAAFIAGQAPLSIADSVPGVRIAAGFRRPALIEVGTGTLALVIAVLHHLFEFEDVGLLVVGAIYLIVQLLSAVGPIAGWRVLREAEEAQRATLSNAARN